MVRAMQRVPLQSARVVRQMSKASAFRFALVLVAPCALALSLFLVMREFRQGDEIAAQVENSHRIRAELTDLLALHQDLEIGQRGLIITQDREFLVPYETARPRLDDSLARIATILSRSPEFQRLAYLSHQKLDFVDRTIAMTLEGRSDDAIALIREGRGKHLMDQIRTSIDRLQESEQDRLNDRIIAFRSSRDGVETIVSAIFVALSCILLLAIAITARAMRLRSEAASKYREISARQVAILESAYEGVVTINTSGSIESLNPAIRQMTGYRTDELIRRDIGILFEIAPDKGFKESFLRRFLRRSESTERTFELLGRRKDGTLFPCEVGVSPVQLETGTTFVAIVRDTTERKRVEQMKSEFVSTVSHELRTPLTSIAGSLGLVAGGAAGEIPEKAARLIQIARDNCDRLVRLINDILDLEKLESGRMEIKLQPVSLRSFLPQAVQANIGYAQQFGVTLELGPVTDDAFVMADPDLLMQVMTNILSNAAKFSLPGEPVDISVTSLDRRWRIDVTDRGPGIPGEFATRIFGKFAQAEATDSRKKGGTGLGLSIVREILNRIGGEVSFDSVEDQGTTFHVDLPRHAHVGRISISDQSDFSVLHVEDDPDVLDLIENALAGRYSLQSAKTLEEARGILEHFRFDVAIVDFALPDGSGHELLPLLRRQGAHILVFTAQDTDQSVTAEVEGVFIKSRASLDGLVAAIDGLLGQKPHSAEENS
ncbi:PAS domain S-box protein [Altererythrobacter buctensis]|uniref:histidine kinase n=2 Tax=Alteraurantiacibacter buctensis TaxID=1503981 RepID=A0A844YT43_9SPHN|nr:PAS domain S-box protein [Alteraurantiacibacter buctensis]